MQLLLSLLSLPLTLVNGQFVPRLSALATFLFSFDNIAKAGSLAVFITVG